MSYPIEEHAVYLADTVRMQAYRRALATRVTPGSVVVDLGSGSGILGLLACEAGASRVYAIDASSMLEVARKHVAQSSFADRFTFLGARSDEVDLRERADLVVADQMGAIGLWAGLLECFADARRRFLKPNGGLLPSRLRIEFSAVDDSALPRQLDAIRANAGTLDFSHLEHLLLHDSREVIPGSALQLTSPGTFTTLELGVDYPERLTAVFELHVTQSGVATGLAGWFSAELAPGIEFSNSPFLDHRIDRHHLLLPFEQPARIERGELLRVSLSVMVLQRFCAWHVQRVGVDERLTTLTKQTSLAARLISQRNLEQFAHKHRPTLNFRGAFERFVLDRCDQENTLESIVNAAYQRFPEQLRSRTRAAEMVARALRDLIL